LDEVPKNAKRYPLKKDSKMVMMKNQKMRYPMGEKILAKKCNVQMISIFLNLKQLMS